MRSRAGRGEAVLHPGDVTVEDLKWGCYESHRRRNGSDTRPVLRLLDHPAP
jgi:hypothetical protein